eukprot:9496636-Pyramimonas_sp.AAC.1
MKAAEGPVAPVHVFANVKTEVLAHPCRGPLPAPGGHEAAPHGHRGRPEEESEALPAPLHRRWSQHNSTLVIERRT